MAPSAGIAPTYLIISGSPILLIRSRHSAQYLASSMGPAMERRALPFTSGIALTAVATFFFGAMREKKTREQ